MTGGVDIAFKGAGAKVGLEVWRIEKMKPIQITDQRKFGQFHTGDSYIVLQTKKRSTALEWHIFFWLGKETSQDEMGVAAYKTVELDDSLGGAPIQHREVQEHESNEFLSIFKDGIKYLKGGVDTGFKHVDREAFETRLLHIKGKRNVRVSPVEVKGTSLNKGDVFVLDVGRTLYQWNGSGSSRSERIKGLEVTKKISANERGGKCEIIVIEDGNDDDSAFFQALGGKPSHIKSAEEGGDDAGFERALLANTKLYKVSDASGKLQVSEIGTVPLKQTMLDTNDCFIVDQSGQALFVWVGKGSSAQEKKQSMITAQNFITQKKYKSHIPVTRVVESGETPLFKANFQDWKDPNAMKPGSFLSKPGGNIAKVEQKKIDLAAMHAKKVREQEMLVDDGNGKLDIYRVENFQLAAWPKDQYGQFYGGDSYVMLYAYKDKRGKEAWIIYFWQGLASTQDEKGASALLAMKMDDELGGAPVQVRVVQGKEPEHFLRMFKGRMIIHEGGAASGFKNVNAKDSYDTDGTRLFQVRGTNGFNTRAVQVKERCASLNSNDSFILESPGGCFAWFGKGATGDEREFAKSISRMVCPGREVDNIMEGSEPEAFWSALGGKTEYANAVTLSMPEEEFEARLFLCSNNKGYFYVEELFNYDQEDLIEEDVMILDAGKEVFVWIGKGANDTERKMAMDTVQKYVTSDPGARDPDTPIMRVTQGAEPPNFTGHFFAWNPDKWSDGKSYEELKGDLTGSEAAPVTFTAQSAPPPQIKNSSGNPANVGRSFVSAAPTPSGGAAVPRATGGYGSGRGATSAQRLGPGSAALASSGNKKVSGAGNLFQGVPLGDSNKDSGPSVEGLSTSSPMGVTHPVHALQCTADCLPSDVDADTREMWLSERDFVSLFKMNHDAWSKIPAWKKKTLKKDVGLW
jgi:hypothetical protein